MSIDSRPGRKSRGVFLFRTPHLLFGGPASKVWRAKLAAGAVTDLAVEYDAEARLRAVELKRAQIAPQAPRISCYHAACVATNDGARLSRPGKLKLPHLFKPGRLGRYATPNMIKYGA